MIKKGKLEIAIAIATTTIIATALLSGPLMFNQPAYAQLRLPHFKVPVSAAGSNGGVSAPSNQQLSQLGDAWWRWIWSVDTATVGGNPFDDRTGALCGLGQQQGNLLFLVGTVGEVDLINGGGTSGHTGDVRTCNKPIPQGTSILLPLLNTECSVLEGNYDPTQPGSPVQQLRSCANTIINHVDTSSLRLVIDGHSLTNLARQFRAQSGPNGYQFTAVPNNPFGVSVTQPTPTLSVADGYWYLLPTLGPGQHTITFGGKANFPEFGFTFVTSVTYNLMISR
jgi:hypothetical protein